MQSRMPHSVSPDHPASEDGAMPDAPPSDPAPAGDTAAEPAPTAAAPAKKDIEVKLEELFPDDEEDDEFGSSAPISSNANVDMPSSPPLASLKIERSDDYSDPSIMLAFYQRLFPFRQLFQWLNYSMKPSNNFAHREFAFTLQNDAYLRYQSFPTADLLRKDILRLNPSRFEIGPVYSTNPRERKTLRKASTFRPVLKELVFDIDLTDYDDIRTCCDKANICNKCWRFITMAVKVIDAALREDFGFKHIMWVYSGRRGAHAWVSDRAAREMDDARRRAMAGYLEVVRGGAQGGKKVNVRRPLHPHLVRSLDLLRDHFQTDVLAEQDPWAATAAEEGDDEAEQRRSEALLALLPDRELNAALRKKWESAPGRDSASKWADIDRVAKAGASKALDSKALLEAKKDVVLEYTYPRLDAEVSKKLNHLLKSPFVVHPKTGRVCVPIDPAKLDAFDPLAVPTVTELLAEIDAWDGEPDVADYQKTRLRPFVDFFKEHVAAICRDERGVKRERDEGEPDPMEF